MTQIQSLMDAGLSEEEIQAMFPDIDFSAQLDQFAGISQYLELIKEDLPGLYSMFGESLPEEVLTIATDLDMTGAQSRWNEFASNPGAITTDAIVNSIEVSEATAAQQVKVETFICKYTEIPEGADKSALTPAGLVAYVSTYAQATTGVDVSAITPENIVAMVAGYKELASGADISTLKPDEITAYVMQYMEKQGVDTSSLTPEAVTAFVLSYEEVTGGARTAALTPNDVVAMVARYAEAEGIVQGMTEAGWSTDAETVASDLENALNNALDINSPSKRMNPVGENAAAGIGVGMTGYSFSSEANSVAVNLKTSLAAVLTVSTLRSTGLNAMYGLRNGINAGKLSVVSAMRAAARAAVNAAKAELKISSPSKVFRDEIGVMTMKGLGEGVLTESKAQAKIIRNAARYLTGEAQSGSITTTTNDNRRTYNSNSSISFAGSNFYVNDAQDAYSLAVEIANLTRRQQRGKGLRMA